MVLRPRVVVFDVNETLFSLDAINHALYAVGAPDGALRRWFDSVLTDGFALAAAGEFAAFRTLARHALASIVDDGAAVDRVLDAMAELDPHPDVRPALERLDAAGVRAVTLTNGHAETTERLLDRAGLSRFVARCHDVGEVGRWKPAPEPYLHCAQCCGVAPERLALVAVHSWDVHGARRAGLVAGYASRHEGRRTAHFEPAHVEEDDLVGVVDALLALPEA